MCSIFEIHIFKLCSLFPCFSIPSGLFDHCMIIHRSCSFWFLNSSSSGSHKFKHIMIKNLSFLSCRLKENISIACFLRVPFWNIPFKSSVRLNLLYFITVIHENSANIKTIGVSKEFEWSSCLKKSRFLFHGCKFTCCC